MIALTININGTDFPCQTTMGAMLRFKEITGREVTTIKDDSFSDLATFLYCCTKAGANKEHMDFPYTLMDFADAITPEDMALWTKAVAETNERTKEITSKKKK